MGITTKGTKSTKTNCWERKTFACSVVLCVEFTNLGEACLAPTVKSADFHFDSYVLRSASEGSILVALPAGIKVITVEIIQPKKKVNAM